MKTALALSDRQLAFIQNAAKPLPVNSRAEFLQRVASHLSGMPSDQAVVQATNVVLDSIVNTFRI
jgi:hypothetical protein